MKVCELAFKQAYIYPNGDVKVGCGWTYQCVGNLLESSLEEIWNGEMANKVRQTILDGSYSCCNKVACPHCANDSLPDLTEEEVDKIKAVGKVPTEFDAAFDYICNHACPSCRHEVFCPSKEYLSNMETIIEKCYDAFVHADLLLLNGNGDCFASNKIMDLLSNLSPENDNFKLELQTNGALCDTKHWQKIEHLEKYGIDIIVTPNSFERQTFKYLSGGFDNVDKVIQNLYFLKELRKENRIKKFDISIVVQDTNYKELPAFVHRCIEDFECDRVIVKPVYYWFALTPEEYWFKDILNPKHPYFNDYMEVLKDPILQHEKVFFWGGAKNIHKEKEHPAHNFKMYFDVFANIMKNDEPEQALEKALLKKGCDRVALYGVNDMSQMMYRLLKKTRIQVVGFIDRDAKVDEFCGMKVTKFDTYDPEMVDTILVSNFAFLSNITKDLRFREFKGQIIPFDEIL